MKIVDVEQGSPEWLKARSGIPTASAFDLILTKTGKPSASAKRYMYTLLAERMMRHPVDEHVSLWMQRGRDSEAQAVDFYESIREVETTRVGFITNDAGTIGASPDRLVGDDGLLEMKVPKEHTHVQYLFAKSVDNDYRAQTQGQLWITERKWIDVCSFHPEMSPALIRVERDEAYIKLLAEHVTAFAAELDALTVEAERRGLIPDQSRAELLERLAAHARIPRSPIPEDDSDALRRSLLDH